MTGAYVDNTLRFAPDLCNGCGMCVLVCPHRVFSQNGKIAVLEHRERCMECGGCMRNCPTEAITVQSGVGCASALMYAALTGKKSQTCGCDETPSCCGNR